MFINELEMHYMLVLLSYLLNSMVCFNRFSAMVSSGPPAWWIKSLILFQC